MLKPAVTPSPCTGTATRRVVASGIETPRVAPKPRAKVALVGLSGYARELCKLLEDEDNHPESRTQLSGVFVVDPDNHAGHLESLRDRGVNAYGDYDQLLADDSIDAVWLPVPISLHRRMAESALRAGKALMLEKPVAGCVADHLAIADVQRETGLPVLIGFQDLYPPGTARIKRMILGGAFGRPRRAVVSACWPRADSYYQRNFWAGALSRDGIAVSDSPLNNAMAHFVNLAMFLLGPAMNETAALNSVTSQLWRVRPIENFDTCSLRVGLDSAGCETDLVVLLTHAATHMVNPTIEIDTEHGTLCWNFDGHTTFRRHDAGEEVDAEIDVAASVAPRPYMARCLGAAVLGTGCDEDDATHTRATLGNSLSHTQLVEAAQRATAVAEVPVPLQQIPEDPRFNARCIAGIEQMFADAAAQRATLAEIGCDLPGEPGVFNDIRSLGRPTD